MQPAPAGSILTVNGWAIDRRRRSLSAVAARIDGGPWHAGWTGVDRPGLAERAGYKNRPLGGFTIRVPLTDIAPGTHHLDLAGKTADGRWIDLGRARPIIVGMPGIVPAANLRQLIDAGEAAITHIDGTPIASSTRNVGGGTNLAGTLHRSSPVAAPLTIVAHGPDNERIRLSAWCAPTDDPNRVRFGTTIPPGVLAPGPHRLTVEAHEPAHRFIGRADTGCDIHVVPEEANSGLRAASSE